MKIYIIALFFSIYFNTDLISQETVVVDNNFVNSINDLRYLHNITSDTISVAGYYDKNDGGGGLFLWDSDCDLNDDGGVIIKSAFFQTGRFVRIINTIDINPFWFGAIGDGKSNDTKSIQEAINYASMVFLNHQQSRIHRAKVLLPSGMYVVDSIKLISGIILEGSGQFSTVILHTGKGSRCIYTDKHHHNRWIAVKEMSIRGKQKTGSIGIYLFESNYDSYIDRVTISEFYDNVLIEDCWTFKITNSHLYKAIQNNLIALNPTAVIIEGNRIDGAGGNNIYIDKSNNYNTTGLIISKNTIQQAGKSGIYCKNIHSISIMNNFFEANNQDGGFGFVVIEGFEKGSYCMVYSQANTFTSAGKSHSESYGIVLKNPISVFTSINDYFSPSMFGGILSESKEIKSFNLIGTLFNCKNPYTVSSSVDVNNIGSLNPKSSSLFNW